MYRQILDKPAKLIFCKLDFQTCATFFQIYNLFSFRYKNFQEELRFFRSTVGMNYDLKRLGSEEGESYAKSRLDGMREMKMKMNYRE